ncbi:hypothetical protein GCM10009721_21060 [Terrabacter tumescens]|uniref:NUDIX hydrolase n=1 Tax=Terrabacter tumescens TaxID=60443 RepID=A0ABQ2I041_9MICO|nr:hypothetical protein [Terrabacter tumescens]GGM94531.1 hypothetical protein GCM10009721_21060 [Terrabacter tumescens]
MTGAQLLVTTVDAAWLPAGGDAEVWVGEDVPLPEPTIIVRLLLVRRPGGEPARFFCVRGPKGLDLPTRFLEPGTERADPPLGVARLLTHVLGGGARETSTRCIGFVRNVVGVRDAAYPHPTPWAHVPVLAVDGDPEPVVVGEWVDLAGAHGSLGTRHWWSIVEHHLGPAPADHGS